MLLVSVLPGQVYMRGSGVVEEEKMEEDRTKNERKRPREPEDTNAKKVKDDEYAYIIK
jgi:hypothetical protein